MKTISLLLLASAALAQTTIIVDGKPVVLDDSQKFPAAVGVDHAPGPKLKDTPPILPAVITLSGPTTASPASTIYLTMYVSGTSGTLSLAALQFTLNVTSSHSNVVNVTAIKEALNISKTVTCGPGPENICVVYGLNPNIFTDGTILRIPIKFNGGQPLKAVTVYLDNVIGATSQGYFAPLVSGPPYSLRFVQASLVSRIWRKLWPKSHA